MVCSVTKRFFFRLSTATQARGGLFWFNICSNRVLQIWDPLRDQRSIFHWFDFGHYAPHSVFALARVPHRFKQSQFTLRESSSWRMQPQIFWCLRCNNRTIRRPSSRTRRLSNKISHRRNRWHKLGKPHENEAKLLETLQVRFGGA